MRLLSVNAEGNFSLTSFTNVIPKYAILSHTWEKDDQEVTFHDIQNTLGMSKSGYRKIRFCSEQAERDNLHHFWVDSCCIDKSNAVEVQTAINSMFRWYRDAAHCYVYLSDVLAGEQSQLPESEWEQAFKQSRWFTRGWTLQELLAPRLVQFFSSDGKEIGSKDSLKGWIYDVTGIAIQALQGSPLSQFSTQERSSWAEKRETTVEEDQVYCLLGIFEVFLPLIYGEGKDNALRRLHDEIDRHTSISSKGMLASFIRLDY
jgi:Heterokaryon incompatibility protein (HET)